MPDAPERVDELALFGTRTAIALIVKSRRDRSVSMSFANVTTGFRSSRAYTSSRNVVTSSFFPSFSAPTVPNFTPTRYCRSAHPRRIRVVSCGAASVQKSRSEPPPSRPRTRSRTEPPTR